MTAEDIRRLHGAAALGTEEALDHQASLKAKSVTIVAYPVVLRHRLEAEALLVHGDRAAGAKHNLIVIVVVTIVADGAASVVLHQDRLLLRELSQLLIKPETALLLILKLLLSSIFGSVVHISFNLAHLLQNFLVPLIISTLLGELKLLEELILQLRRVVDVQQEL